MQVSIGGDTQRREWQCRRGGAHGRDRLKDEKNVRDDFGEEFGDIQRRLKSL